MNSSGSDRSRQCLDSLIGDIYDAALDSTRWQELLPAMLKFAGAPRGGLGIATPGEAVSDVTLTHELDPELLQRWQRDFSGFDAVYERQGVAPAGSVFRLWDVVPAEEYRRLGVYRECFGPGGADDHLVTILTSAGDRGTFFSAYRSESEGPFSAADVHAYTAIAPHLVRAAQIHEKLSAASGAGGAREAALEVLPFGVLLLDRRGSVVSVNREAERIIAAGDALRIRASKLTLIPPDAESELQRAIARSRLASAAGTTPQASVLAAPRRGPKRPYQLLIAPLPPRAAEAVLGFERRHVATLVIVSDPEAIPRPAADTLRRLFALTPALSRLAAALAAGKTVREYADEARVTEGTARQQLKELFARTGTSRQAELVRLILSGVAGIASGLDPRS